MPTKNSKKKVLKSKPKTTPKTVIKPSLVEKKESKEMFVVANWKMNPTTVSEARALFTGIKDGLRVARNSNIVICPPFVYLDTLNSLYKGKKITFGVQTCFAEKEGSFTGEVGAEMARSVGARYVILGHSERRAMGETNEDVRARVQRALEADLTPIVCIGEHKRDNDGEYLEVIKGQLHSLFYGMSRDWLSRIVIAYEPIWAIGKSGKEAVTAHALHETAIYIRKVLAGLFDKKTAIAQTVLYGGSVKPGNAAELVDGTQINGFLVGSASLAATDFLKIVDAVESYAKR